MAVGQRLVAAPRPSRAARARCPKAAAARALRAERVMAARSALRTGSLVCQSKPRGTVTLIRRCGYTDRARSLSERFLLDRARSTCSAETMPSPVVCLSRQMMWPEFSPPSCQPLAQLLQHVAVADLGARERNARARQRLLEAEVGHQRAGEPALATPAPLVSRRDHVQQLVAVVERPRDPPSLRGRRRRRARCRDRPVPAHLRRPGSRMRRAETVVDVEAVGLDAHGDHVRARSWKTCGATL